MTVNNQIYTQSAARYADKANESIHNHMLERPIISKIIHQHLKQCSTPTHALRVLDLGCGDGYLTDLLAPVVKHITAIDSSVEMINLCKEKTRAFNNITYNVMSIENIDLIENQRLHKFDLILSSLALHYVKDWDSVFKKLHVLLNSEGSFLFSISHPFADISASQTSNYFQVEQITEHWPSFDEYVTTYRRSLSSIFNSIQSASMVVTNLIEAEPGKDIELKDENAYLNLLAMPQFLFLECKKL